MFLTRQVQTAILRSTEALLDYRPDPPTLTLYRPRRVGVVLDPFVSTYRSTSIRTLRYGTTVYEGTPIAYSIRGKSWEAFRTVAGLAAIRERNPVLVRFHSIVVGPSALSADVVGALSTLWSGGTLPGAGGAVDLTGPVPARAERRIVDHVPLYVVFL